MLLDNLKIPVADKFNLRRKKGDVGLELETEGENLPEGGIIPNWAGKPDGSLRNGMEYISAPLLRKNVANEVTYLSAELVKRGARIAPTYRSSTHIHENYLDSTFGDVLGAYICWALVEPTVFRVLPAGRDGSLFCVSSYDSGDLPLFVERLCDDIATGFVRGFQPRGKYSSLNISRLGPGDHEALGTLEYRVFPPSMDGDVIQTWCNWTGNIKEFVRRQDDPSYLEMVRWAEAFPVEFLSAIFGHCPVPKPEAAELVDFGARQAYELARMVSQALRAKPKEKPSKKSIAAQVGEIEPVGIAQMREAPVAPEGGFRRNRRRAPVAAGAPIGLPGYAVVLDDIFANEPR